MFPLSVGIAVLRFRLYDLDVVVRKTLIYGAFALFATLIYLGLVVGAGIWLGQDNSFLTMVAAVVVAVTFQPARARLTRFANRVVYGKRATPYEVLSEFSERVGGAYADEDVLPRMARILGEGIGADRADVWLAVDQELRDVAAWPGDVDRLAPIALPNGSVPTIPGVDRVYPVESAGELLGALAIRKPASDPVTPSDEKLIADLAGQAGLVLRNVRLNEELKVRFDELKARAEAPGLRAGRGTSPAGAQHPRRRAAAARGARGQAQAGRQPRSNATPPRHTSSSSRSRLRRTRRSRICADLARGIYPRCSPTKACPPRSKHRCARAVCRRGAGRTAWVGTRKRSRPPCTSRASRRCRTSRSTPRRARSSSSWPIAASASDSRCVDDGRVRSGASRQRHGAAGDRRPAGRARRTVRRHVVTRSWHDARGIAPRGRAGDGVRVSAARRSDPRRSRKASVGSSGGWSGSRWA